MPKTIAKTTIKVEKSKPRLIKKRPKPKAKSRLKKGRWAAICREVESFVKCHSESYKIVKKDARSFLIIKSVFTVEIRKNNNYVHQPYSQNIEGMQYKCFLVIDGLIDSLGHKTDELTKEYVDFEIPIVYVTMPEEVKYKLSDYK